SGSAATPQRCRVEDCDKRESGQMGVASVFPRRPATAASIFTRNYAPHGPFNAFLVEIVVRAGHDRSDGQGTQRPGPWTTTRKTSWDWDTVTPWPASRPKPGSASML